MRPRERDLLADHGPDRDLVAVDAARAPAAPDAAARARPARVVGERVVDRDRVAVGVEQPAAPLDGGRRRRAGRRRSSSQRTTWCGAVAGRRRATSRTRPCAVRQVSVRAYQSGPAASTPGTRCAARKRSSSRRRRAPAPAAAASTRPGGRRRRVPATVRAARWACAAYTSRIVSLNCRMLAKPAAKATSANGIVGRLDQDPGGLGATGPGQRERTGAELGGEQPVEVPRGVADPGGEALDAVALDDAVGDQPHRAAGDVGRDVPVRGAGRGVGQAAPAGPEAGGLRGRGGAVEGDVAPGRRGRRAGRPAVDAGRGTPV